MLYIDNAITHPQNKRKTSNLSIENQTPRHENRLKTVPYFFSLGFPEKPNTKLESRSRDIKSPKFRFAVLREKSDTSKFIEEEPKTCMPNKHFNDLIFKTASFR